MNPNYFGYGTAGTGWNYPQLNPYNSHNFQPTQNIYKPLLGPVRPPYQYLQQLYPQQLYHNSYQPYYPQSVQGTQWNNQNINISLPVWNGMANNCSVPYPNNQSWPSQNAAVSQYKYPVINKPPQNIIEEKHVINSAVIEEGLQGIMDNARKFDTSGSELQTEVMRNETFVGKNYNVKKEDNESCSKNLAKLTKEELQNFANIKKELQIMKGKFENVSKGGLELKPSNAVKQFTNKRDNTASYHSEPTSKLNKKVEVSIDLTLESDDSDDKSEQADKISGYRLDEIHNSVSKNLNKILNANKNYHPNFPRITIRKASEDDHLNDTDNHIMNEKQSSSDRENQWTLDISNLPKGWKIKQLGSLGKFMKSVIISPEGKFFSSLDEAQRFINTKKTEIPNIVLDLAPVNKEETDWIIDEINLPTGWKRKEQTIVNSNGIVTMDHSYKTPDSTILKSDSEVLTYLRSSKTCSIRDIEKFMLSNKKGKPENNMSLKRQVCIDAEVGLNKRQKSESGRMSTQNKEDLNTIKSTKANDVKEVDEEMSQDIEIKLPPKINDQYTTETHNIKDRKCDNILQAHQNEETTKENIEQKSLTEGCEKEHNEKETDKETEEIIDKGSTDIQNDEIKRNENQKCIKVNLNCHQNDEYLLFEDKADKNLNKEKYLSEETLDTLYMNEEDCNEYQMENISIPIKEIKNITQLEYIEEGILTEQDINLKSDNMPNENVKNDKLIDDYIEETPTEMEIVNEKPVTVDKVDEKIKTDFVNESYDKILTEEYESEKIAYIEQKSTISGHNYEDTVDDGNKIVTEEISDKRHILMIKNMVIKDLI